MWNLPSDPMLFLQLGAPVAGQGEYDPASVTADRRHVTRCSRGVSQGFRGHTVADVDLRSWLLESHADLRSKLAGAVVRQVPTERWAEQADGGGSSIAWLLLHLARHHDLALTTVVRDHEPLYVAHRTALGLDGTAPGAGLTEREDHGISTAVDPQALVAYVDAVFDASHHWLDHLSLMALDITPDVARRLEHRAHLPTDEFDWLYGMWSGKTIAWFVQWPVIGHGNAHLGEAISVRNRMGLSPF